MLELLHICFPQCIMLYDYYARHRIDNLEDIVMKTWKNAELVEVSIANTANGFVPFYIEGKYEWLFNDDLAADNSQPSEQPGDNSGSNSDNTNPTSNLS